MVRMVARLIAVALFALSLPLAVQAKTFYWISHGSRPIRSGPTSSPAPTSGRRTPATPSTPRSTTATSPSQQEAVRAAIAAKADGIVTTSPDPGSLVEVVKEARAAGIPIINFNTPDPKANFNAYVGGDNVIFGKHWAQYLVDNKLVKKGDFVWMPVEVPGATYGVQEEEGIKSVFEPLGITYEVTEATLDQAEVITRMVDYLTANQRQDQGDHRPWRPRHRLDQAGLRPGRRQAGRNPGRRLGQLARHHRRKC